MPEKKFGMVWIPNRITDNRPTMRHFDLDSALTEAQRLAISTRKDVFVLEGIHVVRATDDTITDDLVHIEHDPADDQPF